ncbi:MAG: HAD family phosphatase [Planctomycetota bacterium]|nr:HAD family phosphatase [Planctomycetota bacterium]
MSQRAVHPQGALLFDLDGTLVDTVPLWLDAFEFALRAHGVEMDRPQFIERVYQRAGSLPALLESLGIGERLAPLRALRDDHYVALLAERAGWLPGAVELLAAVPHKRLGIVTNSWRRYVTTLDARLGVLARVGCLLAAEDAGARTKPAPDPLLAAAAQLGAEAAHCVYVGDQHHDLVAARAAGMQAWLVPGPYTPAEAHAAADLVLPDLPAVGAAWRQRARG